MDNITLIPQIGEISPCSATKAAPENHVEIGRSPFTRGDETHVSGYADDYSEDGDNEYFNLHGICRPSRARILARAFAMQEAIREAVLALDSGDTAAAVRILNVENEMNNAAEVANG